MLDPEVLRARPLQQLAPSPPSERLPALKAALADTDRRVGRLVEALAGGTDDLPSVRSAIGALERERARLAGEVAAVEAQTPSKAAATLQTTVDGLPEALHDFPAVLATGEPEERKAVVRAFLEGSSGGKGNAAGNPPMASPAAPSC
jgi:hypothetical protein